MIDTARCYDYGAAVPFKSEAQRRKLAMLVEQGKFSKAVFDEWASATSDAKLPERVGGKAHGKAKAGHHGPARHATTTGATKPAAWQTRRAERA